MTFNAGQYPSSSLTFHYFISVLSEIPFVCVLGNESTNVEDTEATLDMGSLCQKSYGILDLTSCAINGLAVYSMSISTRMRDASEAVNLLGS